MAYDKVNWQAYTGPGTGTLLTPARFNQMETQYDEVISYWEANPFRKENEEITVEVASSDPTHSDGRLVYNSTDTTLKISYGGAWIEIEEEAV